MIYSIQQLYLFTLVLTCMSSEHVPLMSGFYTDGLDQALDKIEIVYPEKVSKDGSFVSYYLPHYYNVESLEGRPRRAADGSANSNGDAIHFFVPIEGEKHHLELWPNLNFLAPDLVIERRDARDVENINKAKISQISQKQCHYNGRIVGKPESRAALSTCYGLAGYIQLPAGEEYIIEPVKHSKPTVNQEHPHIMYKRSGIKDKHGNSNCLTKGMAKDALGERLEWESIFGAQVRKDFSAINMNDLVRETTAKTPIDSFKDVNPAMNSHPASSLSQEKSVKNNEMKLDEETVKVMENVQSSYPLNENVQNSYPLNENVKNSYPLNENVKNSYPLNENVQSSYPLNENVKNSYPLNENVQSSYPLNENVQSSYPWKENVQSSYPLNENVQSSYPLNENSFEGNIKTSNPSQHVISPFEKQRKHKVEYGNKLRQKLLKEELGSIKLPDVNFSLLKQQSSQPIDSEHLINKPSAPYYDKDKKLFETYHESRRVKRDLNEESANINSDSDKDVDVKSNKVDHQAPSNNYLEDTCEGAKANSFNELNKQHTSQNFKKKSVVKASDFEITENRKETSISKRNAQNSKESPVFKTENTDRSKEKIKKEEESSIYNVHKIDKRDDEKNELLNNLNEAEINYANDNVDTKNNDILNKHVSDQMFNPELMNRENQNLFKNIENDVKRDIHLDTSEKSWQSGEYQKKPNYGLKLDQINHKNIHDADTNSKYLDKNSPVNKNVPNIIEKNHNKGSESSKVKKSKTDDDYQIMASALESVVRDMDKTKVKKDVLGGLGQPESKNPERQTIYSKAPYINYNDEKYIKFYQTPAQSLMGTEEMDDEKNRIFDSSSKTDSEIIKESRKPLQVMSETVQLPNEKQDQNQVDEIIIRIKTPEGTASEVKQNYDSDNEAFKNNNIQLPLNSGNIDNKDVEKIVRKYRNNLLTKTNFKKIDKEKIKRGLDNISEKEIEDKTYSQYTSKNYDGNSAQDFNIIVEDAEQSGKENEGCIKNKAKREENTIHLVIETEPEVKGPEGHNPESPGSNLFCQGKNCLEIKPVFLNDTKAAITSPNNTHVESPKEKIIEKRDSEDDESCGVKTTAPPLKCFDFNNKVFTLELMITVDYKVVKMHEEDDIENFILTVINMVSSNFDDKSLGFNLNVVLVRLILLTTCIKELDSDRFEPEELLENFCTWQVLVNPGRDDHPHHHDLAVFVSKMDKCEGKIMGVSYMTSVCRPDKACIICVDEGLLLANTITHEIGHSLGADHDDGQGIGCASKLPDGTSYHMAPTITETSIAWSVCSKDAMIQFVKTQGSWCLLDFPVVRAYNFPLMLPGQVYSAAQQCKLNFHMTAIPCNIGQFCNKLYCQITDKLCATKGDPPADGTFCAASMWCFHKQCVHIGRRPGAVNGEWGPWTEWSMCTRSCGGGISSAYRICNNPKPENGGNYCIGERLRYRMCQTKPCQGFTESFRDLQCKRTEDRPFRGKIHNWIQYQSLFIDIECALVCQNRRGEVVMRSPIVADGTPCKAGTQNVCIQGMCRSVGCDYVIGSNAKEDACGVCHGNGTECRIIQGVFDEATTKKALIEFLRIPKDSGMIFVREIAPSANILVVSGSINRVFYLNGLGSEDSTPGDVAFGVTHGVYEKRGGMERIFIRGPTKEDLIFYVQFRGINKGIHYQYATLDYDPTYIPRYQWQYIDWDVCSDPCSGGSQRAHPKCVEDRGGVVDDKYCLESSRPIDIVRPCNDFPCQAKWWVSVWSDCICTGTTSIMFRSVLCMRATDEGGTRVEVVRESECTISKKPPTQKPCNYTEEDIGCSKRSIKDDHLFQSHKDLRRAVNPRLGFSAVSPVDSEESVLHDAQLLPDRKKEGPNENFKNSSKPQSIKNINVKGSVNKLTKSKVVDRDQLDKKKVSIGKLQNINNFKQTEVDKNDGVEEERKIYIKKEDLPLLQSKGRQIAKLSQKNIGSLSSALKSDISKQGGDDTGDMGAKDYEGKDVSENCETSTKSGTCPTEEESCETATTCKQTCAIEPHKKTTCCKTPPQKQYFIKTTLETTTLRPVPVKLDELNMNNFGLTVVPLEYSGSKKLLPQSDTEFIALGNVGQFGIGDELNSTVISGQEALDLLEFARSNASEEPVILHEDMHN